MTPVSYWLINGRVYSGRVDRYGNVWPSEVAIALNRARIADKPGEPIDEWDALALREMGL